METLGYVETHLEFRGSKGHIQLGNQQESRACCCRASEQKYHHVNPNSLFPKARGLITLCY